MEKYKPTFAVVLDTRYAQKDDPNKHPVKLRIIHRSKARYHSLRIYCSQEQYSRIFGHAGKSIRLTAEEGALRLQFEKVRSRAQTVAAGIVPFDFDKFFKALFVDAPKEEKGQTNLLLLSALFDQKIEKLKTKEKHSTAIGYNTVKNRLHAYRPGLLITDLTPDLIDAFCRHIHVADATKGIYLRCIRAIYKQAIRDKIVPVDGYPFGVDGVRIQAVRNQPQYLEAEQLRAFLSAPTLNDGEREARDLWLFSLMCNGANMADIAGLRYSDVIGDWLTFVRQKTADTAGVQTKIEVFVSPPMLDIIQRWGMSGTYIFRFLETDMDAKKKMNRIQNQRKWINTQLDRIRLRAGIESIIHNYTARDTFAHIQKSAGVPEERTGEALGHSRTSVTSAYTGGSTREQKKELADNVLRYAGLLNQNH